MDGPSIRYWVQWEDYDASWDQWLCKDLEEKGVADILKAYHAQGGTAMQASITSRVARPCRLAVPPWRASWFVPVGAPRWLGRAPVWSGGAGSCVAFLGWDVFLKL